MDTNFTQLLSRNPCKTTMLLPMGCARRVLDGFEARRGLDGLDSRAPSAAALTRRLLSPPRRQIHPRSVFCFRASGAGGEAGGELKFPAHLLQRDGWPGMRVCVCVRMQKKSHFRYVCVCA